MTTSMGIIKDHCTFFPYKGEEGQWISADSIK